MIMTSELTPLAKLLNETIASAGDWVTRRDIAFAIGRPNGRLTPYDISVLDNLEAAGQVEIRQEKTGTVRFEFQYRAKGE